MAKLTEITPVRCFSLELTEEEISYLSGVLQNPVGSDYAARANIELIEDAWERDIRGNIWDALQLVK